MPNLPTITVTDAQLAKCVGAFTDAAGYRAWLKAAVRDEVLRRETRRVDEEANAAKVAALAAVEAELPAPDPTPLTRDDGTDLMMISARDEVVKPR